MLSTVLKREEEHNMDQYWLEVAIDTTPDCLDDVAAYLTGCGIVGCPWKMKRT